MALSVDDLLDLTRRVAATVDARLSVGGVTSTDADAARAEVLLVMRGCHADTCTLLLNVRRDAEDQAEKELHEKLLKAVASHLTSGPTAGSV